MSSGEFVAEWRANFMTERLNLIISFILFLMRTNPFSITSSIYIDEFILMSPAGWDFLMLEMENS